MVALRDRFRAFEEWKDFLPIKDLVIPRLQAVVELSERFLERNQLVSGGGKDTVESWYVTLTNRAKIFEEIRNEIAPHGPCIDASISSMMSDAGYALNFEGIKRTSMRPNLV